MNIALKLWRTPVACRTLAALLIPMMLIIPTSCNYYKVKSDTNVSADKMDFLKNPETKVYIHQGETAWLFEGMIVDNDNMSIKGSMSSPPPMSGVTFPPTKSGGNQYYKNTNRNKQPKDYILNEVHIYVKENATNVASGTIPISNIERIDIYDVDKGATTTSHVMSVLGVIGGVALIVLLVAALTKSSCPFVYIKDGDHYIFSGEAYPGAIYASLERDDYLVLPHVQGTDGELVLANKLKEKQFTNQLELLRITHSPGAKVVADINGNFRTITEAKSPEQALLNDVNVLPLLSHQDDVFMETNASTGNDFMNELELKFPATPANTSAKLLLRVKNSIWSDYVFGSFTEKFGSAYDDWIDMQNKMAPGFHMQWMKDQGLAMKVEVLNGEEVIQTSHILPVGPLAFRDVVVPITTTAGNLRIRVTSGYRFWEIDHVALDTTPDTAIEVTAIPYSAQDQKGKDIRELLVANDQRYLEQPNTGDQATFRFQIPVDGQPSTLILHTRGYYNHVRNYSGIPDFNELRAFKKPGAFSRYCHKKQLQFEALLTQEPILASR